MFYLSFLSILFLTGRPNLIFPGIITLSAGGLTLLMTLFQVKISIVSENLVTNLIFHCLRSKLS